MGFIMCSINSSVCSATTLVSDIVVRWCGGWSFGVVRNYYVTLDHMATCTFFILPLVNLYEGVYVFRGLYG